MERIVFLERNTIQANFRRPNFDHEWIEYGETFSEQVVERLRGATIVISNKLPLREAELSQLPDLKLIAIAATGSDNIDLDYCRAHGIAVSNTRGYAVNSVPEHVLMMILALRRNLLAYREDVQGGKWQHVKTVLPADSSASRHQREHAGYHRLWLDWQSDGPAGRVNRHAGADFGISLAAHSHRQAKPSSFWVSAGFGLALPSSILCSQSVVIPSRKASTLESISAQDELFSESGRFQIPLRT